MQFEVKHRTEEADREEVSGVVMKFNVPRTLALTWDFALEHFRESEKTKGPLYGFVEALVAGFLDFTAYLAASEGPASVGGRKVPLLYTDAIRDCFPTEREMRACGRDDSLKPSETGDCGSAETGDCQSTEPGGGKPEDSGDEYPDPQNEERLKQIREELALQPFVVKLPEIPEERSVCRNTGAHRAAVEGKCEGNDRFQQILPVTSLLKCKFRLSGQYPSLCAGCSDSAVSISVAQNRILPA